MSLTGENRDYGGDGLYIDLIPRTCWGRNARAYLSDSDWNTLRKHIRERVKDRCETCNVVTTSSAPLEAHERWSYKDGVQRLERIVALCHDCHSATHLGRAISSGRGDETLAWFMAVTGMDRTAAVAHNKQAIDEYHARSTQEWKSDLSILQDSGYRILDGDMAQRKISYNNTLARSPESMVNETDDDDCSKEPIKVQQPDKVSQPPTKVSGDYKSFHAQGNLRKLLAKLTPETIGKIEGLLNIRTSCCSLAGAPQPPSLSGPAEGIFSRFMERIIMTIIRDKSGLSRYQFTALRDLVCTAHSVYGKEWTTHMHWDWLLMHIDSYIGAKDWHAASYSLLMICISEYALNYMDDYSAMLNCGREYISLLGHFAELVPWLDTLTTALSVHMFTEGHDYEWDVLKIGGNTDLTSGDKACYIISGHPTTPMYLEMLLSNFCMGKECSGSFLVIDPYAGINQVTISVNPNEMLKLLNLICDDRKLNFGPMHVVFDLETSGFITHKNGKPVMPEIVQIAMCEYKTGLVICNNYIRPLKPLSDKICRITHVTNDALKAKPDFKKTQKWLVTRLRHIYWLALYAHNGVRFDAPIMQACKLLPSKINTTWHCTIPLIRDKLPGRKKYSQGVIYEELFGKAIHMQHTAMGDVTSLVAILRHLGIELEKNEVNA